MKIELIIFLLLSLSISTFGSTSEEALKQWNDCLKEQKISKVELESFKKRKSFEYDCFKACVMKKRGTVNNGKIDIVKFLANMRELKLTNNTNRTEEQLRRCATVANKEPNECAVVKNMLDCVFIK